MLRLVANTAPGGPRRAPFSRFGRYAVIDWGKLKKLVGS